MKTTARLAELVIRLKVNSDFNELWEIVVAERDKAIHTAVHGDGKPAEKRGAARALDTLVRDIEEAPNKLKKMTNQR